MLITDQAKLNYLGGRGKSFNGTMVSLLNVTLKQPIGLPGKRQQAWKHWVRLPNGSAVFTPSRLTPST